MANILQIMGASLLIGLALGVLLWLFEVVFKGLRFAGSFTLDAIKLLVKVLIFAVAVFVLLWLLDMIFKWGLFDKSTSTV